jgi:HAD superfamily hydrolase (TIGR01549 family)
MGSSTIRAVVFDAFGTLCEIGDKRWPFARLMKGTRSRREARDFIMTHAVGIREAAARLGCHEIALEELEQELEQEIASIRLYDDAIDALTKARSLGLKIGIASNLAAPYAGPIDALLPFELDAYAWSFEIGSLKPNPRVYEWVCSRLKVEPNEVLMIGDTLSADYLGATAFGMSAFHLDRGGGNHRSGVPTIQSLRHISLWMAERAT